MGFPYSPECRWPAHLFDLLPHSRTEHRGSIPGNEGRARGNPLLGCIRQRVRTKRFWDGDMPPDAITGRPGHTFLQSFHGDAMQLLRLHTRIGNGLDQKIRPLLPISFAVCRSSRYLSRVSDVCGKNSCAFTRHPLLPGRI